MKLLELITYCELKGLVVSHHKVEADWDPGAESHWKIVIANGKYKAMIAYAVLQDTGVIMSSGLTMATNPGMKHIWQTNLTQITNALISNDHELS